MITEYNKFPKGSEWRKWDLHLHAPTKYTCAKHDRFVGQDLAEKQFIFIDELKTLNDVAVIGITDYFSLEGYKFVNSRRTELPNIELILPNIELRIVPVTGDNRKINIHIIPNTEILSIEEIERFLYKFEFGADKLTCNETDLIEIGKKNDPNISSELAFKKGLNEFHISYDKFFEEFNNSTDKFRKNVLIGLSNNSGDGASGIKDIQEIRNIIYAGVDFIFSSQASDRTYFLGEGVDGIDAIIKKYGGLKPCVHGSDYHGSKDGDEICIPDLNRFCWLKADPRFEGLKQILYEPKDRIVIDENKPDEKLVYQVIDKIKFQDPNFTSHEIEINQNLTTIIGGKSTGKSLLLRNIAKSIDAEEYSKRLKAAGLVDSKPISGMEVFWKDGQVSSLDADPSISKRVIYIPQSYLNRVVDDEKRVTDVDEIIKEVLLQDRSFNNWFSSLSSREKVIDDEIEIAIKQLYENIDVFNENNSNLKKVGDEKGVNEQITKISNEIKSIQEKLKIKEEDVQSYNDQIEKIKSAQTYLESLQKDIESLNTLKDARIRILKEIEFPFKLETISQEVDKLSESKISKYRNDWKKEIEVLIEKYSEEKRNKELLLSQAKKIIEPLQLQIDSQKTLMNKYKELELEQKKQQQIKLLKENKKVANSNVDNLTKTLSELGSSYYSIYLEAKDNVNVDAIDDELEFDIQTLFKKEEFHEMFTRQYFDGRSLRQSEYDHLTQFMFESKEKYKDFVYKIIWEILQRKLPRKNEGSSKEIVVGLMKNWFIHNYKVQYQGDQINDMSPGKKSFVLLRLLVDLDNSQCPILIDQPEDDLDNRSIYYQVVSFLRKRKSDRQIIIATHNPNLVLGADAEQIIVANQEGKDTKNYSSQFEYVSGSIEHTKIEDDSIEEVLYKRGIQEHVCDVLEGGKEAFNKRKNKYNFA